MASSSSTPSYLLASLLFLTVNHVFLLQATLLLEDGYAITTVINGDHQKDKINPYSLLPLFESSDLILLDSSHSTFYTISFSSQEGVVNKLAGSNGVAGYEDGELGSAVFNKPKSFAVDYKGNVYVADRVNNTIRKISKSGVTTIAGGYSQTTGSKDGPAQNATFSDDFELAFIPERCAIMITDRGSRLVRQMILKPDDCIHGSKSGVVGMASFWVLWLGLSCFLGMVVGFVCRPYVTSCGGMRLLTCNMTWNHCLMILERRVVMPCFVIRSVIVNSTIYMLLTQLILLSLSTISLMFRIRRVEPKTSCNKLPSLLDSDNFETYCKVTPPLLDTDYSRTLVMSKLSFDAVKDLMTFDDVVESCVGANNTNIEDEDRDKERNKVLSLSDEKIECLIRANMQGFIEQKRTTLLEESLDNFKGLVKLKAV